jgi:glycine/D-amino acid oxidase-like deaminating enzyme
MGPQLDPVASDTKIPPRAAVVVIGGGIIGTSAALFLARKNISVVLCEKGEIGGEQSSRNWGWVRKQGRDSREMPLIIESLRLWEGMNEMVGGETGFRRCGILYVCDSEAEMARRESWLEIARPYQLDTRALSGDEVNELVPGGTRKFRGALYTASDGRAEPQKAAPAIALAARRAGATILTDCAVREIETSGGKIAAVITEKGRIACDNVVLAGGAWSRLVCRGLGVRLPQLKVRASVMRTAPLANGPERSAWFPDFGIRKRLDGGYTVASTGLTTVDVVPDSFAFFGDFTPIMKKEWSKLHLRFGERFVTEWREARHGASPDKSPYEATRILDPKPEIAKTERAFEKLKAVFPVFAQAKVAQHWAGMIDVTPDAVPVISPVDEVPGFFIATGFSGHGFGIGPAAGRLIADLVTGDRPIVDPKDFRYSRFTDGSRARPEASI